MTVNQDYRAFTVSGRTDVGKCRYLNEDEFIITSIPFDYEKTVEKHKPEDESILLVVADGVGNPEAGDFASALIRDYLLEELKADWRGDHSIEALRIAVERSNVRVHAQSLAKPNTFYGATITAVLIEGEVASIAQVGDTRAYLRRGEQLVQVTIDQTMVNQLLQKGLLTKEQEKAFTYSNVVLQALGVELKITVALTQVRLMQNDRLLLCSDGLWRKVSDDEIKEILNSNSNVAEACEKLIESALKKGGEDNITVVLAEATGEDFLQRAEPEPLNQMFTILTSLEDMDGLEEVKRRMEKDK
jgi:serine/threonine protein phosphatase PrpC